MFDDLDDFDWDEEFDSDEEEDENHLERLEDIEDELVDKEDELVDREDELIDKQDEIIDKMDDVRDRIEDGEIDAHEEMEDLSGELQDNMGTMKRELAEIRRMKEDLRKEIQAVRHEKTTRIITTRGHDIPRVPSVPRAPRAPRAPRRAAVVDFSSLTDDLEDMMDGLGEQIEMGLKSIGDIRIPHLRLAKKRKGRSSASKRRKEYEDISPERIAHVIGPLGGEERLKILNFLKEGGKTFNELEIYTGKTGSSLTHHLSPLVEAGYVIKGEVRGTYYVTVEGRLAYRLAQWLTSRLEEERVMSDVKKAKVKETEHDNGDVSIQIEDDEEDDF